VQQPQQSLSHAVTVHVSWRKGAKRLTDALTDPFLSLRRASLVVVCIGPGWLRRGGKTQPIRRLLRHWSSDTGPRAQPNRKSVPRSRSPDIVAPSLAYRLSFIASPRGVGSRIRAFRFVGVLTSFKFALTRSADAF